jgi:integrase
MRGDGIRRRKDRGNTWYITFTVTLPNGSKQRHNRRAVAQSFQGARRELEKEREKIRQAKESGIIPMTFKEGAAKFLQVQRPLICAKEFERQSSILDLHLKPFFTGQLAAVSRERVERYIAVRSEKVSPGTVRKEVNVIKKMLRYFAETGFVLSNAASHVKLPRAPAGRVRYLQPEELRQVLERCSPEVRAIAQLAVATGMRRGEILRLRWLDVDLMNRCINLPQTKNGEGRTVYLNELALDVFRSLWPNTDTVPEEPVFGLDVTPEEVSMSFMRACRDAGVEDFHLHDLRHTHAAMLRQNDTQLDIIAKQLGHRDLRQTARYAHVAAQQVREAVDSLNPLLSTLKAPGAKKAGEINRVTRLN